MRGGEHVSFWKGLWYFVVAISFLILLWVAGYATYEWVWKPIF